MPATKQRRNRVRAAEVKALAEKKGVGLRAAQKQIKAQREQSAHSDDIPPPQPSRIITSEADFDLLPEPERMMIIHWELWDNARTGWRRLAHPPKKKDGSESQGADPIVLAELGLSIAKLRQEYIKARGDWEDYRRAVRLTISAGELDAMWEKFLLPFIALLQSGPSEVANMCEPEIRTQVMENFAKWLVERVQPQASALIDSLEGNPS